MSLCMRTWRHPLLWRTCFLLFLASGWPWATVVENGWRLHLGRRIPWNIFSPKAPFQATVVRNHELPQRLTNSREDPDQTGETCHITLSHHGQVPFLEGQSIGVIAPGPDRTGERPAKLRLYSVASSRSGDDQRSKTLSLCVKRVLGTSQGESSPGICSNYLCDVQQGEKVVITGPTGNEMLLPEDLDCNLILVATGAGIAPIRSQLRHLFHDRDGANADGSRRFKGLAWLFFGVRSESSCLYDSEQRSYEGNFPDNFRYDLAISRDGGPGEKAYVQTQMSRHMDDLWQLLKLPKTHLYVCGLKALETSISKCLASAAEERGEDWNELYRAMRQAGRYHVEVY